MAWSFGGASKRGLSEAFAGRARERCGADGDVAQLQPEAIVTRVGERSQVATVDVDPVVDESPNLLSAQAEVAFLGA